MVAATALDSVVGVQGRVKTQAVVVAMAATDRTEGAQPEGVELRTLRVPVPLEASCKAPRAKGGEESLRRRQ
uniref:Uncharacterized protein n=1 Tax=Chromera velia CCMP2878 TaxID=1169474 RepID=A0A0G4HYA0_9ALVE|eukprot:Cvel_9439.t1-p1 / transcript=Cvel_9439.t1 / gene=Cvel_9439 / organism=Chromera_velia_CCMP2878 / gene_product=hypothetical protein / transcript_product=hypothetical protein / location=Cvel_scaffold544:38176-38388(+) / protein_length=71 / sequence_SO=supercontig / SO=protein_coding / is_pseudo=false